MRRILFFIFTISLMQLSAQTVTLTGQYKDKKSNPIENAKAVYWYQGAAIDSVYTDAEGVFVLTVDKTFLEEASDYIIKQVYPNPFSEQCSFQVKVRGKAAILVTSLKGNQVDKLKINKDGIYTIRWGGYNRLGKAVSPGNYYITLITEGKNFSAKVIFNGKGSSRLQSEYHGGISPTTLKQLKVENDKITLTKENTSPLELSLNTPINDTLLGVITGNAGPEPLNDIDSSMFTLQQSPWWNLNLHIYNDDQSIFEAEGEDFYIQDSLLKMHKRPQGEYSTNLTATDPQDPGMQAEIEASVLIQYTMQIPDHMLAEDSKQDTLISDLNDFVNEAYPNSLSFQLVQQSNAALINLYLQDNALLIDSLQTDGYGESEIGIKITDGDLSDTVFFTVQVQSLPDLSGQIKDIFDTALLVENAVVIIEENGYMHYDTTDSQGRYEIQLNSPVDSVTYYPVTIRHGDYTPFHTWATVVPESRFNNSMQVNLTGKEFSKKKNNRKQILSTKRPTNFRELMGDKYLLSLTKDYSLVPSDFEWELYNEGFRRAIYTQEDYIWNVTFAWVEPPMIHIFNDSSLVSVDSVETNYNNTLYNLNNILPTFNPVEALPQNIVEHPEGLGYTAQPNEMGIYWSDECGGTASAIQDRYGPIINTTTVCFTDPIGNGIHPTWGNNNNAIMNQELGTGMGAVMEPDPWDYFGLPSPTYETVFSVPPYPMGNSLLGYTGDDHNCSTVRTTREKVHLQNLDFAYGDPDGLDWELRPDLVEYYTNIENWSGKRQLTYEVLREDGTIEKFVYDYDKVPDSVKRIYPMMFKEADQ
ncbi:MAG: hypothetical protein K9G67_03230 [Bacteroidales bacterium]|nr:hypothetical protein [Bacteroidales bacterium]MCF8343081.1 hypothetical protein [Bacteroidales bacterium]MCF8352051.1 hypothetical protein [Bacteroidales bacterium]MCF8375343.1 hypothetical protein [Bacteroidales bacterium]MCF8400199.1 hypothetical protein [Bacteroidales bacterium]